MELRHLIYFEAVVRHCGFTRAAEALHVAQPSVSAQIKQLERTLGVQLLIRTARSITLTPAGERLLHRTRRIMDELEAARQEMAAHAAALRGHVRIGATPIVGDLPLADLLARFRRTYPGVSLDLSSDLVDALLDRLAAAELDVVIGPLHAPDSRFITHTVADEHIVLITSTDDERSLTNVRQVAEEPFICLPQGSGLHDILMRCTAQEGFAPQILMATHSPHSIRDLVSTGMGVALVAESSTTAPGQPVKVHQLRHAPDHPPIAVFTAKSRTDPAVRALCDLIAGSGHAAGTELAVTR
ncbi:LysR family transcriptional regulator [Actinomyces capricornis]|uniref:LysR family transcriptional regulator n=1 Tax=Actinomyces capricornis TaxID=2755559 RepID=A0ABM7UEM8_9ACTO|nr:LysR family transcriptional regulator [Actinomyces capricornis]BDA65634.1 LysR family transcriptional regulator [Actinomyces capricornis]